MIVFWCNGFNSKRPKIIKLIPKMERCGPIFDVGQTKSKSLHPSANIEWKLLDIKQKIPRLNNLTQDFITHPE